MRIQWDEYNDRLGMAPVDWLAAEYPFAGSNKELADNLARALGIKESLYDRVLKKASVLGIGKDESILEEIARYRTSHQALPLKPAIREFVDWPTMEADPVCITGDWHVPYYNHELARKMMLICKHWDPPVKNMIVAGDFVDFDQISSFISEKATGAHDIGRTLDDDLQHAQEMLDKLAAHFKTILLIRGNHEDRLYTRKLEKEVSYERTMRVVGMVPGVVGFSQYPFCILNDTWRITHPKSYSRIPGTIARRLAEKHRQSIICAHGHNMSLSVDVSGENIAIDGGGMMNPAAIGYYALNETTHPVWQSGFIIISNNKPHLFNNTWTNWQFYEKALGIEEGLL